jgi:hypothetical protein
MSKGLVSLVALLLLAGCSPPSMMRPAYLPVRSDAEKARFSTTASSEIVRANACALAGSFKVGDRMRNWTVTVGERPCWSQPNADSIPLYVYMDASERHVMLEAEANDDVPEETLHAAVASTGLSLKDAIDRTESTKESIAQNKNNGGGGGKGGAIAAAATAGGLAIVAVVVIVVVVVGAIVAGFAALFSALGKGI